MSAVQDNLVVFKANQVDPTRSKSHRQRFRRAFGGRLRTVRGSNREFLSNMSHPVQPARAVDRYRSFIITETNEELVEPAPRRFVRRGNHWTSSFVAEAYRKGLDHAEEFLSRAGYPEEVVRQATSPGSSVHHQQRQFQFLRAFIQTEDLGQRLTKTTTRVFEEGIASQQSFREMADESNSKIRGTIANNADSIANTVVVSTVNQAALAAYREANVEQVGVQVEAEVEQPIEENYIRVNAAGEVFWQTAMDGAVCPDCLSLEGAIIQISELTGQPNLQPPIHPNCRCILVPMPMEATAGGEVVDPADVFGSQASV